jgi:predicted Zn-dependent protease
MRNLRFRLLLFCLLISLLASCAVNPVTGKRELMLISEQSEISLGQEADEQIRSQYGIYDDPALNEYVRRIGMTMAPETHRPHLTYHFAVLDTPVVNAFALPGGYIYVTRGVLAAMNSEAELAVVLGHELGHVNARHSAKRLSNLILVQAGLAVGGALSETFAKISGTASIGVQLLFLKYSRDDERQADQLGIEYARQASYNPQKMIDFFTSLQKLGDLSGGHSLPGFLSTHPLTKERITNTQAMITKTDKSLTTKQNAFLKQIDNIVFGNDPRQGFIEGNTFYHPQMRFYFTFPKEWNIENTPLRITLVSKDKKAGVIFLAEKSAAQLKDYAGKKAESIEGRQLIDEQSSVIHGFPSFHQLYIITQEDQQEVQARFSYIKQGPYIFTFSALSSKDDFKKYNAQFKTLVSSFNNLKDPKYLNRQPQRLKLIRANGKQRLRTIFQSKGIAEDLWSRFAIMNAMQPEQIPQKEHLIKVVE